ncbi:hypothetical protein SARC_01518 [Sphaeroforma arctica JP610]|uniref:Fe2OG dioxygenase domain-containing protein n=1 Tax=Sphaeroforma arctica JP610 TaxID=667725 RepID=A0A0L0GBN8_9EUKA|nr:hypothetical protein SARC_01518 [Sphaeroforma arctica JP610]KNC86324.1 hypothetical protein SARC_01518 [Sphaeroforma arctica JP610]|eukprot:XP_014160226.1 hypothetical protein SARC_01518 [Sphaeroforma arctica JP610]
MTKLRRKDLLRKQMQHKLRLQILADSHGDPTDYYQLADTWEGPELPQRRPWTDEERHEFLHMINIKKAVHVAVVPIISIDLDLVYKISSDWVNTCAWEDKITALTYSSSTVNGDRCASSLIKAGADPSIRWVKRGEVETVVSYAKLALRNVRAYILSLKLPLAVWLVKQVIFMRKAGVDRLNLGSTKTKSSSLSACETCSRTSVDIEYMPLVWNGCEHVFCEACVWAHICSGDYGLTFACTKCAPTAPTEDDLVVLDNSDGLTPSQRKHNTSEKYYALLGGTHSDGSKGVPKKSPFRALSPIEVRTTLLSLMRAGRKEVLFQTVVFGDVLCLMALYTAGMDVELEDQCGETPLSLSVFYGHVRCVKLLLWAGANPNATDREGNNLCTIAAKRKHSEVLQALLDGGAKLSLANDVERPVVADGGEGVGVARAVTIAAEGCGVQCEPALQGRVDSMLDLITLKNNGVNISADGIAAPCVTVTTLIEPTRAHPGAGATMIDGAFTDEFLDRLISLFHGLPLPPVDAFAEARRNKRRNYSKTCAQRRYFMDHAEWVTDAVNRALALPATAGSAETTAHGCTVTFPRLRFLHYLEEGGRMEPHVDLSKTEPASKINSTHTLILYLHDVEQGGETVLLDKVGGKGAPIITCADGVSDVVLARVLPRRGRLLLFPHLCPHEGLPVVDLPKLFLRGELY